jgi:hypothetical protein
MSIMCDMIFRIMIILFKLVCPWQRTGTFLVTLNFDKFSEKQNTYALISYYIENMTDSKTTAYI